MLIGDYRVTFERQTKEPERNDISHLADEEDRDKAY